MLLWLSAMTAISTGYRLLFVGVLASCDAMLPSSGPGGMQSGPGGAGAVVTGPGAQGGAGTVTSGSGGAAGNGGVANNGGALGGGGSSQPPAAAAPPPATVRRLTKLQLTNTVQAVFGVSSASLGRLSADVRGSHGYENSVQGTSFSFDDAKAYFAFVEEMAFERLVPATVAGCALTTAAGEQCTRSYLEGRATKLMRRPLTAPEVTAALQVYTTVLRASGSPEQAFRTVISHLLLSPHFQYRTEIGGLGATGTAPVSLTPYEMASGLSYLLWNSCPDDQLLAAAQSGALVTPSHVAGQVSRMLRDPQAQRFADTFSNGYLVLIEAPKDATAFPTYNATIGKALIDQTNQWMRQFILSPTGTFGEMLTNNQVMATAATARWYGVGTTGLTDVPRLVPADIQTRAGFLTQPAFIASRTHSARTSPVHTGEFIANNLLCIHLGAPPLNAAAVDAALPANATQRQRSAARIANPNCTGCHSIMDPLGLPFEAYDPTGAHSTSPGLDLSSTVVGSQDADGPISGPVDLSRKLSTSQTVHTCFAKHMFRYINGRYEKPEEEPTIQHSGQQFFGAQGKIEQLILSLVQNETFLKRSRP
jgi:hypothetical protein